MSDTAADARKYADRARAAARILASAPTRQKDDALTRIAAAIRRHGDRILEANGADLEAGREAGLAEPFLDRLALDSSRLEGIAGAVEAVRDLPDPIAEITAIRNRPNGLQVRQQRIPLGVILAVYESRPNVTVDAAALCLKSGNASILRGGREALGSNMALWSAVAEGISAAGLPPQSVQLVDRPDRELLLELIKLDGMIDLAIPRGGEGLIRFVAENARVPVIKHYKGVCHLYLDESAPEDQAVAIALDGKSRPSACNSIETLLVHGKAADRLLPAVCTALRGKGIELRAEPRAHGLLRKAGIEARLATPDDFGQEFLAKILAVKVVDDMDAALEHIATHGSLHTEAIVTTSLLSARRFGREVEASCVLINASTRFNDGGELGLGAEIGISTTKLHAFGPMGLRELTAKKFVVLGEGQIRG